MRRAPAISPIVWFLLLAGCTDRAAPAAPAAAASLPASGPTAAAASAPAAATSQPMAQAAVPADPEGIIVVGLGAGFAGTASHPLADGPSPARFNKPIRLEPMGSGAVGQPLELTLADISNHAVRRVTVSGDRGQVSVRTVAGRPDMPGHRDNPAGKGDYPLLSAPHGVASTRPGTVVIAEASNHTLRRATLLAVDGAQDNVWRVTTLAGKAGEMGFADGKAADARFSSPHGICAQGDTLYIADIGNKRLRRFTGGEVTTVAGTGDAGAADGPLDKGMLTAPIDVFCEKDGGVLIADAGTMSIRRWREGEGLSTLPVDRALKVPHSVTVDGAGRVLVAELDGHTITEITGGTARVVWGTGAAGSGPGQLNRPADVLAYGGYLWVADLNNHQLKARPWPEGTR